MLFSSSQIEMYSSNENFARHPTPRAWFVWAFALDMLILRIGNNRTNERLEQAHCQIPVLLITKHVHCAHMCQQQTVCARNGICLFWVGGRAHQLLVGSATNKDIQFYLFL